MEGGVFEIVTYENILSPPPLRPGQPFKPDTEGNYKPVDDVLYLPGVEVMIRRRPVRLGFTDAEVVEILKAIRVTPL